MIGWLGAVVLFFIGVIVGFLLCGFFSVCAEDEKEKKKWWDEQKIDRR